VALYGLTAVPVARRLGVTRPTRSRPVLVGGDPWVIDLARAFRSAGLEILMWAPSDTQRTRIKQASIDLAPGELLASAIDQSEDLEGVTAILLLTDENHYNDLAATTLAANASTPVYRLAPDHPDEGANATGETLFGHTLTGPAVAARYANGARIRTEPADGGVPPDTDLLFLVNAEGALLPVTASRRPAPRPGDTLVLLGPPGRETAR
jgi:hypothetical protein